MKYKIETYPNRKYHRVIGPCRNCNKVCCLRPRFLCWKCASSADIRNKFPSEYMESIDGSKIKRWPGPMDIPPEPTKFLPGTPEKIAVLTWRVENGYLLWHPDDAVRDDDNCDIPVIVNDAADETDDDDVR
jgi:hypothetical protein